VSLKTSTDEGETPEAMSDPRDRVCFQGAWVFGLDNRMGGRDSLSGRILMRRFDQVGPYSLNRPQWKLWALALAIILILAAWKKGQP
jgi:hypothetical protein